MFLLPANPEAHTIRFADAEEVTFWTQFFDCTEAALRDAAATAGVEVGAIQRYFNRLRLLAAMRRLSTFPEIRSELDAG